MKFLKSSLFSYLKMNILHCCYNITCMVGIIWRQGKMYNFFCFCIPGSLFGLIYLCLHTLSSHCSVFKSCSPSSSSFTSVIQYSIQNSIRKRDTVGLIVWVPPYNSSESDLIWSLFNMVLLLELYLSIVLI